MNNIIATIGTNLALTALILAGMAIWMTYEVRRAKKGYEDKDGFHYGKDPRA